MTYLQLESADGATVIRFDEQETSGSGWQATKVTGLGMSPVALTTSEEQVGQTVRFVRRLPRDIDVKLSLKATGRAARESKENALYSLLQSGKCVLRKVESSGNKYLNVWYAGGGNYDLGEDSPNTDTELELVITLRAPKPDWKAG